ncbi:hypothetical protein B0H11DRAFT_1812095 [Mycena galericulata]|nr:hypothetical protein B0H11DRAFT_1812095 [Mycena galericulata]
MASLQVLLNDSVSAFSAHETRVAGINDIDLALKDVERARGTVKAANRSPVKKALKLFRNRSTTNLDPSTNDDDIVLALAQDAASGREVITFQLSELLLLHRALRTRRNSLAPISRLPTEILAAILELCPTIEDDRPHFRTRKFVRGVKIAHVCRRWRDVAMANPQFWTHIVLSRPRWALEMLHRSRSAPLVVGVDLAAADSKTVAARDLVLGQLTRIRELRLCLPMFDRLPSPLFTPAPILDTFYLWTFGRLDFIAPASLFHGDAPCLRHLSLRACQIESESPIWDTLVSLELIKVSLKLDTSEFLGFLVTRMSRLRNLTLNESFPDFVDYAEPIRLDLETLELTASSWLCYCFLRTTLLPKCRIVLNVPYSNVDLRFAWDALESQRIGADDPTISGVKLIDLPPASGATSTSCFEVSLFDQASRDSRPSSTPRYSVRLTIRPPTIPNWREDTLHTAMAIVSLDQVASLTVECEPLKLPLPFLQLKHFRTAAFHAHLEPFTHQLEGDPLMGAGDLTRFDPVASAVHYPALRQISFHDVLFSEKNMEVMLDWLAQRKRLNLGIEEVRLVRCGLAGAELGSLSEVVNRVHTRDE